MDYIVEFSELNPDEMLEVVTSKLIMQSNGWKIYTSHSSDAQYIEQCGSDTWFGYSYGYAIGSAKATFVGQGEATLTFGNCYHSGQVLVYLNDKKIAHANALVLGKEVTFNYSRRDDLMIKEVNTAIIKLNSLRIRSNGTKTKH